MIIKKGARAEYLATSSLFRSPCDSKMSTRMKFSGWCAKKKFSSRKRAFRSAGVTISQVALNPAAIDIPYAPHAALEIDDARTISGSPPAPSCTLVDASRRHRISHGCSLQRVRADRRHRVRDAFGPSVLARTCSLGKGALAPCPPSINEFSPRWWARCASPTLQDQTFVLNGATVIPASFRA